MVLKYCPRPRDLRFPQCFSGFCDCRKVFHSRPCQHEVNLLQVSKLPDSFHSILNLFSPTRRSPACPTPICAEMLFEFRPDPSKTRPASAECLPPEAPQNV